ncbi:MAG: phosphoglyceromutase [Maribacter sp.]|nr:phosphoglyceromutase [Maribacter sp.]
MRNSGTFIVILFLNLLYAAAQTVNTPKVILITLDGMRWQEVFTGADSQLISNKTYVKDHSELLNDFWRKTPTECRKALMPFFWNEAVKMGQMYGNRKLGNTVDLTNTRWFSYPGYNEILSGKADDERIDSNDKVNNPNTTLLEIANNSPKYHGKVAVFGSWDVFPFIVNEKRSGVPVNAGFRKAKGSDLTETENFLNELQDQIPSPWGSVRLDAFTYHYALEYMKREHPELLYIAFGETDDFAHDGDYAAYLKSAHSADAFIKGLWEFTQQDPFYKGNTIFIVTTDHGRGTRPLKTWRDHGSTVEDSGQVWLLVFGNNVKILGEVNSKESYRTNQIAPTIVEILQLKIDPKIMEGRPIHVISQ